MLKLQSISKRIGTFELRDISLAIEDGQYFVLLGPSGVGKTVLLEIIAGLIKPGGGRIFWDDRDITFEPPEKRGFAVVYQDYALFSLLTVAQNIGYGLKVRRVRSETIKERTGVLAQMLGISEFLNRRPGNLSGGQQQRVALARALAVEPKLLLLDEPLAAVDANLRIRLRKELKQINKELNISVLHVTHDPQEAMSLGDKVCVMLNQQIRQTGTVGQLFHSPSDAKVAKFLGISNVLAVSKVEEQVCTVGRQRVHVNGADETTCYIWIRPEEIILSKKPFDSSARNQFECTVTAWDHRESLLAVQVVSQGLGLTALITYTSFEKLGIKAGTEVFATFKSSAVHCF